MDFQKYQINKDYKSVYYFLKDEGYSERFITFLRKDENRVLINGKASRTTSPLKNGDILQITSDDNTKSGIMRCILGLDVVYEDEYYLIVNKPSGLATIPTKSHYTENLAGAVAYYLSSKIPNYTSRVMNRLDFDTAGLVIFAKNLIACNKLKNVEKIYYALCKGKINKTIEINKPIETITQNGINQRKRVISQSGKAAITYVTPVKIFEHYSLIKCQLKFGRTHQIRVHLSSIGHPLLGDTLYGTVDNRITHTALVCKEITFTHPFINEKISLSVDLPNDFKTLI